MLNNEIVLFNIKTLLKTGMKLEQKTYLNPRRIGSTDSRYW